MEITLTPQDVEKLVKNYIIQKHSTRGEH